MPAALKQHIKDMAAQCETHVGFRRQDRSCSAFVHILDLDRPVAVWTSSWICRTCSARGNTRGNSFAVKDADIKAACPGTLISSARKFGCVYMTPRFLINVVHMFFEVLNVRAVRQELVRLYSASALARDLQSTTLQHLWFCIVPWPLCPVPVHCAGFFAEPGRITCQRCCAACSSMSTSSAALASALMATLALLTASNPMQTIHQFPCCWLSPRLMACYMTFLNPKWVRTPNLSSNVWIQLWTELSMTACKRAIPSQRVQWSFTALTRMENRDCNYKDITVQSIARVP